MAEFKTIICLVYFSRLLLKKLYVVVQTCACLFCTDRNVFKTSRLLWWMKLECRKQSINFDLKSSKSLFCMQHIENIWKHLFFFFSLQGFQSDIEGQAPIIRSLLQLCQNYEQTFASQKPKTRSRRLQLIERDNRRFFSNIGGFIQNRWHHLWLRSLEWQCFLEQLSSQPVNNNKVRGSFVIYK